MSDDSTRRENENPQPGRGALARALSRRGFLKGAGGLAAGGALAADAAAEPKPFADPQARVYRFEGAVPLEFTLNGEPLEIVCETRTTLLDLLRTYLPTPLTGTKEVCDRGACGACTVLLDGQPVYSCNTLAASVYQREVVTVEGLGSPDALSPVQKAFWKKDATMCGFCTPGFVVSVSACLEAKADASDDEIRAACAGNLCRCGTYPHIWQAAREASRELSAAGPVEDGGPVEEGGSAEAGGSGR